MGSAGRNQGTQMSAAVSAAVWLGLAANTQPLAAQPAGTQPSGTPPALTQPATRAAAATQPVPPPPAGRGTLTQRAIAALAAAGASAEDLARITPLIAA